MGDYSHAKDYLVLIRRIGEGFKIGDDIHVVVTKIKSTNSICIAIKAPKDIRIVRDEIRDKYANNPG